MDKDYLYSCIRVVSSLIVSFTIKLRFSENKETIVVNVKLINGVKNSRGIRTM